VLRNEASEEGGRNRGGMTKSERPKGKEERKLGVCRHENWKRRNESSGELAPGGTKGFFT